MGLDLIGVWFGLVCCLCIKKLNFLLINKYILVMKLNYVIKFLKNNNVKLIGIFIFLKGIFWINIREIKRIFNKYGSDYFVK